MATRKRGVAPKYTLAQKLQQARARHDSWRETAAALGVSERTLRRWRAGESKPDRKRAAPLRQIDIESGKGRTRLAREAARTRKRSGSVLKFDTHTRIVRGKRTDPGDPERKRKIPAGWSDVIPAPWQRSREDLATMLRSYIDQRNAQGEPAYFRPLVTVNAMGAKSGKYRIGERQMLAGEDATDWDDDDIADYVAQMAEFGNLEFFRFEDEI